MEKYSTKIAQWNEEAWRKEKLFISKLREAELSDFQIEKVLEAIESTCNRCWDSDKGCQCWNDE